MKFQPPKGTRDFLPDDATKFQKMIDAIRATFEKYGFKPLFTPAFESFELLSAKGGLGEAVKDEIYYFKDKSDRELGLRFDLTMPLARVVSSNPQLSKPFKLYQIDTVWRYDNPQALRWRQFWQADIDIVGSNSVLTDAECLACVSEVLDNLGFKDYSIRVSDRRLLQKIIDELVPKTKVAEVFRIIDKLDKIGFDGMEKQLKAIGLDPKKILEVMEMSTDELFKTKPPILKEAVEDLSLLLAYAKVFGIEDRIKIDLSLVRGLEYYTSLVFEVNLGAKVSCGGGGRYNNLIETIGGTKMPATGISLGLDRIFEVMKEKKMFDAKKTETKVFVANVNEKVIGETIEIAQKLRREGLSCQTDLMNKNLTKQLEYVNSQNIPYVLIVGPKELKGKKFKLKDMRRKTEKELTLKEIVSMLKTDKFR